MKGQDSILFIEKSSVVMAKNYVFEPENFTLQIKEKEKEKEKEKGKDKKGNWKVL